MPPTALPKRPGPLVNNLRPQNVKIQPELLDIVPSDSLKCSSRTKLVSRARIATHCHPSPLTQGVRGVAVEKSPCLEEEVAVIPAVLWQARPHCPQQRLLYVTFPVNLTCREVVHGAIQRGVWHSLKVSFLKAR